MSMRYLLLDRMDSVCSMSYAELSLGEHLLCIRSAKMPCTGSREESCLCLAREERFLFSWKQPSSLWWRNPRLSSKDEVGRESEQERQRRGLEDS